MLDLMWIRAPENEGTNSGIKHSIALGYEPVMERSSRADGVSKSIGVRFGCWLATYVLTAQPGLCSAPKALLPRSACCGR